MISIEFHRRGQLVCNRRNNLDGLWLPQLPYEVLRTRLDMGLRSMSTRVLHKRLSGVMNLIDNGMEISLDKQ